MEPIIILHLEDNLRDAELAEYLLESEGMSVSITRVEDKDGFERALRTQAIDLILSDYSLPSFDGPSALDLAREINPEIPFIFLSGSMGEDLAVESLKQGALDYVLKSAISRLPAAIARAIEETRLKREKVLAEREQEASYLEILKQRDELEKVNARLLERQSQLVQSEKLAGIGQLAAGIAHEINNPMAFITSNLRTLTDYLATLSSALAGFAEILAATRESSDPGIKAAGLKWEALKTRLGLERMREDVGPLLSESLEGARRVNEIVRSLKSMSRSEDSESRPIDVQACLERALKLAWGEMKHKASVVKEFVPLPVIPGRQSQLEQVFLNLLVNAAQAIPESGTVTLRTRETPDGVMVEVEDNGTGISQENLGKLFTPFFTTKPIGQGTGLGLSISYGIIQAHGGTIEVRSEPGRGTAFTVFLPKDSPFDGQGSEA